MATATCFAAACLWTSWRKPRWGLEPQQPSAKRRARRPALFYGAGHYLRPRAVYFDNKHEQFTVFADYLFPDKKGASPLGPEQINQVLRDGEVLYSDGNGMWFLTFWDVRYVPTNQISDHFHLDHKDYYDPYLNRFQAGLA